MLQFIEPDRVSMLLAAATLIAGVVARLLSLLREKLNNSAKNEKNLELSELELSYNDEHETQCIDFLVGCIGNYE